MFVAACVPCAQSKASYHPPAGLLRSLPALSCPWSHIAVDIVTGLPLSGGHSIILTIVDRFSKVVPSVSETADLLTPHVFQLHSLGTDIVSDWGSQFASQA